MSNQWSFRQLPLRLTVSLDVHAEFILFCCSWKWKSSCCIWSVNINNVEVVEGKNTADCEVRILGSMSSLFVKTKEKTAFTGTVVSSELGVVVVVLPPDPSQWPEIIYRHPHWGQHSPLAQIPLPLFLPAHFLLKYSYSYYENTNFPTLFKDSEDLPWALNCLQSSSTKCLFDLQVMSWYAVRLSEMTAGVSLMFILESSNISYNNKQMLQPSSNYLCHVANHNNLVLVRSW